MWCISNGEAETVRVQLKPAPHLKKDDYSMDFSELAIKSRYARGNVFTKYDVKSVTLRSKGVSTLGGRKVWFDPDILRINYDGQGTYLGEFQSDDRVLVITKTGNYFLNTFELTAHFDDNILRVEKFDPEKVWSLAFYDGEQNYFYGKRFQLDASIKPQNFLGDNPKSYIVLLNDRNEAIFQLTFKDETREDQVIVMADFIGVKTPKGKGKRFTTLELEKITDITPAPPVQEEPESPDSNGDFEAEEPVKEVEEEVVEEAPVVVEPIETEPEPEPAAEEQPVEEVKPVKKNKPEKKPAEDAKPAEDEATSKPKKKSSSKKKEEPVPELDVPFEIVSKMPEDSMPYRADEDGQLSLF